ncbi:DUF2281 domain-containing protein [Desulfoferrobacter suflitae]|uniref:DUF2281 domain-containing protein n=1 Tax=Desulfoferrobacter suflitae TaxID=2865782 RepID=UPI002164D1FA|nr:DUF2281 domain-containing protein [Desulfoferrobacter suflitae]MCK8603294.1 DUF2281 domain-containing protein [Desulfoferrobacter suflitae]MDD3472286.1 DUF2281 domain-containing protein [Syntrophaceae bacterium]
MREQLTVSRIKQKLHKIPPEKLQEIVDFIDFILTKETSRNDRKVEKLEGIWQELGFEKISNLDKSIREIRQETETGLLERISRCGI